MKKLKYKRNSKATLPSNSKADPKPKPKAKPRKKK
jgi:hypothetical protein